MNASEKLKALREQKGMSQADCAKAMNIDRTTYAKYENGGSIRRNVEKLASFFNVSVDYLLGRTDEPQGTGFQKVDGGNEGNTVEETDDAAGGSTILMRAQSELSPEELAQIEHMAKFFLDQKAAKNDK